MERNRCYLLKQGFGGTGYNENVRMFVDYASRLYLWDEAIEIK